MPVEVMEPPHPRALGPPGPTPLWCPKCPGTPKDMDPCGDCDLAMMSVSSLPIFARRASTRPSLRNNASSTGEGASGERAVW